MTFKETDCELLEGAKFRYALRHITKMRRSSMPNCTSIVNYREKFGLSEERVEEKEESGERRIRPVRRVMKRSITR